MAVRRPGATTGLAAAGVGAVAVPALEVRPASPRPIASASRSDVSARASASTAIENDGVWKLDAIAGRVGRGQVAGRDRGKVLPQALPGAPTRPLLPPRIRYREPLEAFAARCLPTPPAKSNPGICPQGPISP